jgi:hypothetical protein
MIVDGVTDLECSNRERMNRTQAAAKSSEAAATDAVVAIWRLVARISRTVSWLIAKAESSTCKSQHSSCWNVHLTHQLRRPTQGRDDLVGAVDQPCCTCYCSSQEQCGWDYGQNGVLEEQGEVEAPTCARVGWAEEGI